MTITTTLGVLAQAEPALHAIGALKLPAKSAYHVKKLATLVAQETQHFQTERNSYIKELGIAQPDGSVSIAPDSPAMPAFVAKVTELIAVEVVIPWGPITLAMLGDATISAAELQALGPLFAEPDGESA
jgi:hypothetical protein